MEGTGNVKKKTLTYYKKRAWAQFSLWIRLKNADKNGFVTCYTCGVKRHYKDKMHAGHGIGGRNNSILFEPLVVRCQCLGCNIFGGGKYAIFTRKLIDELGLTVYDKLVTQSNKVRKMTQVDYEAIYEAYKDLCKELL